jgi:hypothetical protein
VCISFDGRHHRFKAKHPHSKLRILCLTDGSDTNSVAKPTPLSEELKAAGIVVDCICIGDEGNDALLRLSKLSGGFDS